MKRKNRLLYLLSAELEVYKGNDFCEKIVSAGSVLMFDNRLDRLQHTKERCTVLFFCKGN